jgi:hypothetical protein
MFALDYVGKQRRRSIFLALLKAHLYSGGGGQSRVTQMGDSLQDG